MTAIAQKWGPRIVWSMVAISLAYVLLTFSSEYLECRSGGGSQVACFAIGFFVGYFKVFWFLVVACINLISLLLP